MVILEKNHIIYIEVIFNLWLSIKVYINNWFYWISDISWYNFWDKGALNKSQYIVVWAMNTSWLKPINWVFDEVRIYNRALSEAEIKSVYGSTLKN